MQTSDARSWTWQSPALSIHFLLSACNEFGYFHCSLLTASAARLYLSCSATAIGFHPVGGGLAAPFQAHHAAVVPAVRRHLRNPGQGRNTHRPSACPASRSDNASLRYCALTACSPPVFLLRAQNFTSKSRFVNDYYGGRSCPPTPCTQTATWTLGTCSVNTRPPPSAASDTILIHGTAHCADLYPPSPNDVAGHAGAQNAGDAGSTRRPSRRRPHILLPLTSLLIPAHAVLLVLSDRSSSSALR